MMILVASAALAAAQAAPAPAAPQEPAVVAEARAFMDAYARDLAERDRKAVAERYDRRGSYRMGRGEKHFDSHATITNFYATKWVGPDAFAWKDLSFEPLSPDAVMVAGQFLWTPKGKPDPVTVSYTGLLVRQDGVLRIRLEDEDAAPK